MERHPHPPRSLERPLPARSSYGGVTDRARAACFACTGTTLRAATATQMSPRFRHLLLRDGHELGEIKSIVTLLQIISGIMAVGFAVTLLIHADAG